MKLSERSHSMSSIAIFHQLTGNYRAKSLRTDVTQSLISCAICGMSAEAIRSNASLASICSRSNGTPPF
jgi:hypothetical protein